MRKVASDLIGSIIGIYIQASDFKYIFATQKAWHEA
jgi:hypothetical protein